jgi:hypothetical protein
VRDANTRGTLIALADDYDRMAVTREAIEKAEQVLDRPLPEPLLKR